MCMYEGFVRNFVGRHFCIHVDVDGASGARLCVCGGELSVSSVCVVFLGLCVYVL